MRHLGITFAAIAVTLAATVGGIVLGSASGRPTSSDPAASSRAGTNREAGQGINRATVQTATATVAGKAEMILVDANGLPLYIYAPDTTAVSRVTGQLAVLWPPLVAAAPTVRGATGRISSVRTTNGEQVAYNGHFLYTFVEDAPSRATGQGVQNFFVATPGLTASASLRAGAGSPGAGYRSGYTY